MFRRNKAGELRHLIEVMILEANARLLEQSVHLLATIDDAAYTAPAELFGGQRIGGHIRHVIDFYECLIRGLPDGVVDYDARRRDSVLETDRRAAMARLEDLARTLRGDPRLRSVRTLRVASEGATFAESTIGRELQAVASHTVHHFALVALLLQSQGCSVPAEFGVSKATLDFRAAQRREAA